MRWAIYTAFPYVGIGDGSTGPHKPIASNKMVKISPGNIQEREFLFIPTS